MKQGPNSRRPRGGRPGGRRPYNSNSSHSRTLESNGPNVKLRGTVSQLWDKYQTLARDAISSGNRVSAENYFQHAEHYLRLMNGTPRPNPQANSQPRDETAEIDAPVSAPESAATPAEPETKPDEPSSAPDGGEPKPPVN